MVAFFVGTLVAFIVPDSRLTEKFDQVGNLYNYNCRGAVSEAWEIGQATCKGPVPYLC